MLELLSRLAVALAIGLLVGLERGWQKREEMAQQRAAGFRTFALSGLLGGMSGVLALISGPVVLGFIFVGYTVAFTAFHWLEARKNNDLSVTSVVAGMLTFILGAYAAMGDLQIAIASAVAMTGLLALREPMHQWVAALRWEEIRAILILLAMSFLLLPVLPDRTIDPWDSINPSQIWLLAILIAAISFGGYLAIRWFGDRLGVVMAALAGGLASSTATTLTLGRLGGASRDSDRLLSGGILIAGLVMVVRVGIVTALLNRALLGPLWLPLAGVALTLLAAATLLMFRNRESAHPEITITNPLELGTALKLATIITIVILAAKAVQELAGDVGILIVAAISGVADVDAITISMARLGGNQVDPTTAVRAIGIAVAVNTMAKTVMAGWVGGKRIAIHVGTASLLALAVGAGIILLI